MLIQNFDDNLYQSVLSVIYDTPDVRLHLITSLKIENGEYYAHGYIIAEKIVEDARWLQKH